MKLFYNLINRFWTVESVTTAGITDCNGGEFVGRLGFVGCGR